ncbi:MAG: integrase family protein [Acetobacteraceae bacterium]|nr:integrase family protein [Acetobacteraceae bacterium]
MVWDDELPGFGARVTAGGHLAFVLKYRVKGPPEQRFLTLGDYPAVHPDAARTEARQIKQAAALGRDLVAERRDEQAAAARARAEAERRAIPLASLLDAWRAITEAEIGQKIAAGRSVLYERELLRLEARLLRPAIGAETVGTLDPARFQAILHLQPSVSTARNLRNLLVRFIGFARATLIQQGISVEWPTQFEVRGRPGSRDHRFTLAEAARIWIAAPALGRRGAMIRFMLLTGCRRIEAQRVEWSHLVLEDPVIGPHWLQPAALTKNNLPHRVPLSPPAVALLRWLPPRRTKKSGTSPLVFAGRGGKPVQDWRVIRRALLEQAGVEDGTLHDFRRTIVSTLGDHGFDPQVADTLLNHAAAATLGGVMGVYQRSEFWATRSSWFRTSIRMNWSLMSDW